MFLTLAPKVVRHARRTRGCLRLFFRFLREGRGRRRVLRPEVSHLPLLRSSVTIPLVPTVVPT